MNLILKQVLKMVFIPLALTASAAFYKYYAWIQEDNFVEEMVEDIIKENVGIDIDLTPESKEKDGDTE